MAKFFHNGTCDHSFISDESYCLMPNNLIFTSDGRLIAFTRRSRLQTDGPTTNEKVVFEGAETDFVLLRLKGRVSSRHIVLKFLKSMSKLDDQPLYNTLSMVLVHQYNIHIEDFFLHAPDMPKHRNTNGLPLIPAEEQARRYRGAIVQTHKYLGIISPSKFDR